MLNKKFLTKLLNPDFRKQVLVKNRKYVDNASLKLKQYATYVVDKHMKERNMAMKDVKAANYGLCPIDVIAYCIGDEIVKTLLLEFNSVNHFLRECNHDAAVEVVMCVMSQIAYENKKDINAFDIDKIEAYVKRCEEEYAKAQEEMKSLKEENDKKEDNNGGKEIHKEANC